MGLPFDRVGVARVGAGDWVIAPKPKRFRVVERRAPERQCSAAILLAAEDRRDYALSAAAVGQCGGCSAHLREPIRLVQQLTEDRPKLPGTLDRQHRTGFCKCEGARPLVLREDHRDRRKAEAASFPAGRTASSYGEVGVTHQAGHIAAVAMDRDARLALGKLPERDAR